MKAIRLILIGILLFGSCKNSQNRLFNTSEITVNFGSDELDKILQAYLKKNLKKAPSEVVAQKLPTYDYLQKCYQYLDHKTIWLDNGRPNAKYYEMLQFLEKASYFGLDPGFYDYDLIVEKGNELLDERETPYSVNELAEIELIISNSVLLFMGHLNSGFLNENSRYEEWRPASHNENLIKLMTQMGHSENVKQHIFEAEPKTVQYQNLRKGLVWYLKNHNLSDNHFHISSKKDNTTEIRSTAKKALIAYDYLSEDQNYSDSAFKIALKQFQKDHGIKHEEDIGKLTKLAFEKSNMDRFINASYNLDKLRKWDNHEAYFLMVNIPSFSVYAISDNNIEKTHRVIVGKPSLRTPEFSAHVEFMITNPYWHVPNSIASKEMLPKIKRNPSYLSKNNYRLYRGDQEINPHSVNWSRVDRNNFHYRIRQESGDFNALGRIKIMFPNRYSVYLHDTPTKKLFERDVRGYSHGCIRLNYPVIFAGYLLKKDGNNYQIDDLYDLIASNNQKRIYLKNEVPIHIKYFTSLGTPLNHVVFYDDIYSKNKKHYNYLGTLFKNRKVSI